MSKKLPDSVIKARMIEWRNLKKLHAAQNIRIEYLEAENKELKQQIIILKAENAELKQMVQDLLLRVEELNTMVFGKKKKHEKHEDDDHKNPPTPRTPESYKRPLPSESDVTEHRPHPLNACTYCHGTLTKRTTTTHYEEDLPLPQKKTVIKHAIEKGFCSVCKKWSSGAPAPAAKVILGEKVQKYIAHLSVIARLSFAQIRGLLYDIYTFSISDGEIAKILTRQAVVYRPEYEQLKEDLHKEPRLHADETGWRNLKDGSKSHAWSASTPEGKALFLVGESRGKGNVETLLGKDYKGTVITDDYAAYDCIPKERHQLCWAHPLRKFRDLAQSGEMKDEKIKTHHVSMYRAFRDIFYSVRKHRDISFLKEHTQTLKDFARIDDLDCKKARTYKKTLLENIPKYLTCLSDSLIPMTNNQAERSLRHLVLKRKVSFGSHSKKTAGNLAVLLSVFISRKHQDPKGWFGEVLAGV